MYMVPIYCVSLYAYILTYLFLPNLCVFILDLRVKINYCIVNHRCFCCDCMHEVVLWSSNFEYKAEEEKPSVESTN